MKRRKFIKHVAHSLAIPGILGGFGTPSLGREIERLLQMATETGRVLVLIYLDGGNDGLNTVVPLNNYSALTRVRPHVIMPEDELIEVTNTDFAFHPALEGFKSLYDERRLQVIHSVGYPQQNFSHFRSKDIWMSASDSDQILNSGWAGRYLEKNHPEFPENYPNEMHPHPLAVEIGLGASMLFQGERIGFSMVINNVNSFYELLDKELDEVPDGPVGDKIQYIRIMAQQSQKYGRIVKEVAEKINFQRPYPDTRLANQLKIVSRLIAGGLKTPLYLVRLGGFDTHDNQVVDSDRTVGRHANLLKELNDAIMAFMKDLEYHKTVDRVMGMTFSEFGRRIVSNSSGGTDHGSAAPMFVFGNMSEGTFLGEAPRIRGSEVYDDNLPLQFDFRQIYTSLLSQWFESNEQIQMSRNAGRTFEQVPVIRNTLTNPLSPMERLEAKFYPNPVRDFATLSFNADGDVKVDLIDVNGRVLSIIHQGEAPGRPFNKMIDFVTYPPGRYIIQIRTAQLRKTIHVIKI
ncbi:DUF1501 domain-containing protein [Cecembia calidifontis]|jgi:uncharacterized protein (DUF1501 family)|uniref:Putative secreted protein (Por secretion system target) n=1 Tax=Cecembia calidifontis TaxID=1187080 RepID=A0A4Q7PAY6_9BACT|nr:DUF1501 domain-containing protein [Cecembia calidifontis]RZS97443.1 putative secreted protein (Por secretion system target) [Cecembia calidifontis]